MKPNWQPEIETLLLKEKHRENQKEELWNEDHLNDDFFNALHDKIMREVEQTEIQAKPFLYTQRKRLKRFYNQLNMTESLKRWSQAGLKASVALSALFFGLFAVYSSLAQRSPSDPITQALVKESRQNPETFSESLLNSQDSFDFVQELARRSDKSLNTNDL